MKKISLSAAILTLILISARTKTESMDNAVPHGIINDTIVTIFKAKPEKMRAKPEKGFRIGLRWKATSINKNYLVTIQLVDKDGHIVLKDDHEIPATTTIKKGLIEYSRLISLPIWEVVDKTSKSVVLPEGTYIVQAGLYNKNTKKSISLNIGPGVLQGTDGLYKVGILTIDSNAPVPGPGEKNLDLKDYYLTFDEEFDSLSISPRGPAGPGGTRWIAHTPWNGDFGDAKFIDPEPGFPFTVKDGILSIEVRKVDGQWKGGLLSTVDMEGKGFTQKMGYFECRAKLPVGPGTWPAFWLMGTLNRWGGNGPRYNPEVDILEQYGHWPNRFSYTLHLWGFAGLKKQTFGQRIIVFGMEDDFHTYGILIDENIMILYFDRIEMYRMETPEAVKTPLYPLINFTLGPGWPTDKTPNPSKMLIDYVRVYSKDTVVNVH